MSFLTNPAAAAIPQYLTYCPTECKQLRKHPSEPLIKSKCKEIKISCCTESQAYVTPLIYNSCIHAVNCFSIRRGSNLYFFEENSKWFLLSQERKVSPKSFIVQKNLLLQFFLISTKKYFFLSWT